MTSNDNLKQQGRPKGATNKNAKLWTDIYQNNYISLFNRYVKTNTNANKDTFIKDNKTTLGEFINNEKLSDSRKKDLYFMVGRWLLTNNDEESSKIFSELGYQLMQEIRDKETEGVQSIKEEKYYMDIGTLKFIAKSDKFKKLNTVKLKMGYLLLMVMIYQPTLRANFYETCRIITDISENDNMSNYILITNDEIKYIVNNDKITNQTKNNMVFIDIEDDNLQNIIRDSFEENPRDYLFEDENEEPYSYFKLTSILRHALSNPNITLSMIRSAYINDYYSKNESVKSREWLSKRMRHSFMVALVHYSKIRLSSQTTESNDTTNIDNIKNRINEIKKTVDENKQGDQAYKKLRANTLFKLNDRNSKPRQSTIDKYNFIYDDNLKLWI